MGARRLMLACAAAGVLLAGGAVAVTVLGGGDGGGDGAAPRESAGPPAEPEPPANALEERWRSAPLPGVEDRDDLVGTWLADDVVVSVTTHGARAFDSATGEQRWELTTPVPSLTPCAASPEVNAQGIGAVLLGKGPKPDGIGTACNVLGAVDTGSGELLWAAPLPDRLQFWGLSYGHPVTIGDEVITVALSLSSSEDHLRYSVDGEELPLPEVPGSADCWPSNVWWAQGARHTLAKSLCTDQLTALDTQSGELLWTLEGAGDEHDVHTLRHLVADAPLTFVNRTGQELTSFTEDGQVMAWHRFDDELRGVPAPVGDAVLVARLSWGAPHDLDLAAVDLETGEPLWSRSLASGTPVGGEEGHYLAVAADGREAPYGHRLLRLDARDGTPAEEGVLAEGWVHAATADGGTLYAVVSDEEPVPDLEVPVHLVAYERPR